MIIYMFHETNRKLIEMELLERLVGNVLTSLIHIRIENHVTQTCDKTFDVSQLIPLENVRSSVYLVCVICTRRLSNMKCIYRNFSVARDRRHELVDKDIFRWFRENDNAHRSNA